jgi:hypothetical protein
MKGWVGRRICSGMCSQLADMVFQRVAVADDGYD